MNITNARPGIKPAGLESPPDLLSKAQAGHGSVCRRSGGFIPPPSTFALKHGGVKPPHRFGRILDRFEKGN